MSQSHEYRIQTGIVAPAASGTVKLYANASGTLVSVSAAGVTGNASAFGLNLSQAGGTITTGVLGTLTGSYYGIATGIGNVGTFLATPNQWLPVTGPSGEKFVIPAYLRTT